MANKIKPLSQAAKKKILHTRPLLNSKRAVKASAAKPSFAVGCHVSIAGGVWNAPENAAVLECETFQIFTRSPHGGPVAVLTPENIRTYKAHFAQYNFTQFVIHAPYIINFGSKNPQVVKNSIQIVRGELERGSQLGAVYVMFHPGSIGDQKREQGITKVTQNIAEVLKNYAGTTQLLLEISAGAGNVIGDSFEEIKTMVSQLKSLPGFGGVCFDTQHAFASGYDFRTLPKAEAVIANFQKIIGLKWLKMVHVNDSKTDLGSKKDRHEHIGQGKIGKTGIKNFLTALAQKKHFVPLILETEHDTVKQDIAILKSLARAASAK